jgi:hypothetical protein
MNRYQFIWWFPCWNGFHFTRFKLGLALIYEWSLMLGYVEIRKWRNER